MSIAVVIATRDRPSHVAKAVDAVAATLRAGDELVVADSASRPPVVVTDRRARVVRVELPGASLARNAGVAATAAPIVAFTDDDCRPRAGWLDVLDRAFADDERVGVVTGAVVADRTGRFVVSAGAVAPRTFTAGDDPAGVAHGANLAVRREAFVAVGGFDERLGPGATFRNGEDYDLFWRVLEAGWAGRHVPEAVVTHVQWRSTLDAVRAYYRYGVGDGAFAVKHRRVDLLRGRVWDAGLRRIAADVRDRNESAALADAAKLAGVVHGAVRARFTAWGG